MDPDHSAAHSREGLRYETDLTDAEWALIEPLMPTRERTPREWPLREVMNAIFYVLRGGVAWRLLPTDLPPRTTVYRWFSAWRDIGLFEDARLGPGLPLCRFRYAPDATLGTPLMVSRMESRAISSRSANRILTAGIGRSLTSSEKISGRA